jgi:hypothetical protein
MPPASGFLPLNPLSLLTSFAGLLNPEGIPSFSPGLRVGELPWVSAKVFFFNPEGVAASAGFFPGLAACDRCGNPFRVGESLSP